MEGRAPSHWAQSPSPRKAAEQVFPKSHLTMYAKVRFFLHSGRSCCVDPITLILRVASGWKWKRVLRRKKALEYMLKQSMFFVLVSDWWFLLTDVSFERRLYLTRLTIRIAAHVLRGTSLDHLWLDSSEINSGCVCQTSQPWPLLYELYPYSWAFCKQKKYNNMTLADRTGGALVVASLLTVPRLAELKTASASHATLSKRQLRPYPSSTTHLLPPNYPFLCHYSVLPPAAMGLSVSRLLSGLFGKKEMREYTESMIVVPCACADNIFLSRYIDGLYMRVFITTLMHMLNLNDRLALMQLVKRPFYTSSSLARLWRLFLQLVSRVGFLTWHWSDAMHSKASTLRPLSIRTSHSLYGMLEGRIRFVLSGGIVSSSKASVVWPITRRSFRSYRLPKHTGYHFRCRF